MRIFLIGLMGSGKTTIGRRLAARTGWPYVDNDALVQDVTGRTAPRSRIKAASPRSMKRSWLRSSTP